MRTLYWVMYSQTVPLQAGGERTSNVQHFGTEDLEVARKSMRELRDYASKGQHFIRDSLGSIGSAWIEQEQRWRMEL